MSGNIFLDIDNSWLNIFDEYNLKYEDKNLDNILNSIKVESMSKNIYPDYINILNCFKHFKLEETKVVILGQDPYHNINEACGISFGVNNKKPPPSLKNIIKELRSDLNISMSDYTLLNWSKQGILMLNTALTVIEKKPASHLKLWYEFTKFIIDEINKNLDNVIFIAWGSFAHKKLIDIDIERHYLIISSHPSPLSAYKKYKSYPEFIGSKPFSKTNEILEKINKDKIIW
jgi:uracil-DNA glycosylase